MPIAALVTAVVMATVILDSSASRRQRCLGCVVFVGVLVALTISVRP